MSTEALVLVVGLPILIYSLWQIVGRLDAIRGILEKLRVEQGAGLGVNIDHPHGHLDGGHLAEIVDDVRDRRKRERTERQARDVF